jgi:hypothetical protein
MLRNCGRSVALATLIGWLFFAGSGLEAQPATTLYGIMGDNTSFNYQFATVDTTTGLATTLFSFSLSYPLSGLAYDPSIFRFVALGQAGSGAPYVGMVVVIDAVAQTIEEHAITGLPVSPFTNFVGVEYDQTLNQVLLTYGQDAGNGNLQNRIAAINPLNGTVLDFTEPALAVTDFDIAVFNPATSQLIDADTNDSPFEAIADVFGTPVITNYANPPNDGELSDGAVSTDCPGCLPTGTMFFSRRATLDLRKLALNGLAYDTVGDHSLSGLWAFGGLAFAPELAALAAPAVPAVSPRLLGLLAVLLMTAGLVILRRLPG